MLYEALPIFTGGALFCPHGIYQSISSQFKVFSKRNYSQQWKITPGYVT